MPTVAHFETTDNCKRVRSQFLNLIGPNTVTVDSGGLRIINSAGWVLGRLVSRGFCRKSCGR